MSVRMQALSYWSKSSEEVINLLNTSEKGLTAAEAGKRLKIFGQNSLNKEGKKSLVLSFLSQFLNPLVLILLFASLLTVFLRELTNSIIIFSIVVLSGVIDFYQQYEAESSAEKLKKKIALTTSALRDGVRQEIPVSSVTIGDLIILEPGDIVPADARLITSSDLIISESALTGESFPEQKEANQILSSDIALGEKVNSVFMGCGVISGSGKALVTAVGLNTEFGRIYSELNKSHPETDFTSGIRNFGFLLMKVTLILVVIVFFINAYFKHDVLNSFLFALALAIGLTPELLPMVITINLSRGAIRMSLKGVIVKDLPSIENFGSMNVLCTDKTGTLTEDHIKLERYENVTGQEDKNVLLYGFLNSHFQNGTKTPLEKAILAHHEITSSGFEKTAEIPFDFNRKRVSVIVKNQHGKYFLITKGELEGIVKVCKFYQQNTHKAALSDEIAESIENKFRRLSSEGFRVLGLTIKEIDMKDKYKPEDESEMVFLGTMSFLDPAKQSARSALERLGQKGINVKVLTGDNEIVTKKICSDLGLEASGIITGIQLQTMSDLELIRKLDKITIFARVTPLQKERIILALKKHGKVVGFMGDGVNDAPSLRSADVGISVENGVDVAKESANLILLHKDLHVLIDGVFEGRKTYNNIMKYIMMSTSSNFGNMFSVAGASLVLPFLPMLPVQILLNNLLYDISQLAISQDNVDSEDLNTPKKWNINFIKHFMLVFGPISSVFDFLTFLILLAIFKATVPLFQTGWFVESLISQIIIIFSIRTKRIPFYKSEVSRLLVVSALAIILIGLILPVTRVGALFSLTSLPLSFYLFIPLLLLAYILSVERAKEWFYQKYTM